MFTFHDRFSLAQASLSVSEPATTDAVPTAPARPVDFRTLFELEADYVARTLRRMGVSVSDLEDATHEVFIAVHARLAEYDTARPIRPWLFAFAYRVACAARRRPHHRVELREALPDIPDAARRADDLVEDSENRRLLLGALQALCPEQRAVLVMHEIDGVAMPDVALALSVPLNTAYSRLRLGREDLTRAVTRLRAKRGDR